MINLISISFLSAIGCTASMENPPFGASVIINPDSYSFEWNETYNKVDQSGRLFAFDVVVTDASNKVASGMPLPHVKVEIFSLYEGIYLVPQEALELVSYPGLPGDVQSIQDVRDQCTDEFGNYSHAAGDWCAWYWDTSTNMFYEFTESYASAYLESNDTGFCGEGNAPCTYYYGPTHWLTETDSRGIIRGYAIVDYLVDPNDPSADPTQGREVDIVATIGYDMATMTLEGGGGGGGGDE